MLCILFVELADILFDITLEGGSGGVRLCELDNFVKEIAYFEWEFLTDRFEEFFDNGEEISVMFLGTVIEDLIDILSGCSELIQVHLGWPYILVSLPTDPNVGEIFCVSTFEEFLIDLRDIFLLTADELPNTLVRIGQLLDLLEEIQELHLAEEVESVLVYFNDGDIGCNFSISVEFRLQIGNDCF